MFFRHLLGIMRKEFRQITRDALLFRFTFIAPIIQLIIFGFAATTDLRNIPASVYAPVWDQTAVAILDRIVAPGYFNLLPIRNSAREVEQDIMSGRAEAGIIFPVNLQKTPQIQLFIDGSNLIQARNIEGYFSGLLADLNNVEKNLPIRADLRVWFNEDIRSANFMVPGVIAMISTIVSGFIMALSITREKESGALEQLLVTPIRPMAYILGKTIPFGILAFIDILLVFAVGVFLFQVPFRGSIGLLFLAAALYLLAVQGIGLLVSVLSANQHQALLTFLFIMMPTMMLSGFISPVENIPIWMRWISYLIPMKYFIDILRGLFLKGLTLPYIWVNLSILAAFSLAIYTLAIWNFRKHLE